MPSSQEARDQRRLISNRLSKSFRFILVNLGDLLPAKCWVDTTAQQLRYLNFKFTLDRLTVLQSQLRKNGYLRLVLGVTRRYYGFGIERFNAEARP